ncbi:MAG: AMP-binding protein [Myxococcota bacterium]|nr:AMP-binding protein [Myxococcota bacterium]
MHRLLVSLSKPTSALIVEERSSANRDEVNAAMACCRAVLHGRSGRLALEGRAGIHFMVWVYAAWSEGLSVLPIDAGWPAERKASLLRWADAGQIDCEMPLPNGTERRDPILPWDETAEAMVLFTSGTSGDPKGLRVSAQSLLADLDVVQTPHAASVFWASVGYSQSAYALVTYALGHTVLCVDRDTWLDGSRMKDLARRSGIERVFCTPSYARESLWLKDPKIHVGLYGEQADDALLTRSTWTDCYGQTEAPSLWFAMRRGEGDWVAEPKADLAILDAEGRQIEGFGIVGRLVVRNRHFLATSYLDGEPLADPYDTGDRAEWTGPGRFKLRGRVDHMVKLRGFRVELEGVEAALRAIPEVGAAAVRLYEQSLVAYVVPRDVKLAGIKRSLRLKLPDHEIPTRWVRLDELPLNQNHKVDRRSLPDPTGGTAYRAPQTAEEVELCDHWSAVLEVAQVGLDDDFFDLGGHSLLALRLSRLTGYGVGAILSRPTPARLLSVPPVLVRRDSDEEWSGDFRIAGFAESVRSHLPFPMEPRVHPIWFAISVEMIRWVSPKETRAWLGISTAELILPGDAAKAAGRLSRLFARHPILTARIDRSGALDFAASVPLNEHILKGPRGLAGLKRKMCGLYDRPLALAVVEDLQVKLIIHHAIFDNRTLQVISEDWKRLCENDVLLPPTNPRVFQSLLCAKPLQFQGATGFTSREVEFAQVLGPPIAEKDVWSSVVSPVVNQLVAHYGNHQECCYFMLVRDRRFDDERLEIADVCGPLTADQVYRVREGKIERTAEVGIRGAGAVWINIIQGELPEESESFRWRRSGPLTVFVQLGPERTLWTAPVVCLPKGHDPLPPIRTRWTHPRRSLAARLRRYLIS